MAKLLTLLIINPPESKIQMDTSTSYSLFDTKNAVTQAPIFGHPDPEKQYIVYTDASDDACGAQLLQEHNGTEFPIDFLSHSFTDTQKK